MKRKPQLASKSQIRKSLFCSACMLGGMMSTAAHAQTVSEPKMAVPDESNDGVIVVTAQRREQNVQDVPISLQVISGDFINSVAADDISGVSPFIPGLEVSAGSPTQPRYRIRGVSTSDFGAGTDPAVGVYVDGFYSSRSGAAVLAFGDIERIEVLKGPQGTLFGRNSAAGAVSIITKKPVMEFEAEVAARLGNYEKRRFDAMVNVPLADNLALRVNGLINSRNGLFRDAATGEQLSTQDNWATRAALRWEILDSTDATLTWTHDELNQDARPAIGIVPVSAGAPAYPANPQTFLDPFKAPIFNDVIDNHETRNLDELTLTINHDFGAFTLTSLSSWRQFSIENREDEDGTNRIETYFDTNNREDNESWYQEFRAAGEVSDFNWIVGTSYFHETAEQISDTFTFTDTVNTTLGNIGFGTPFTDLENGLLIPLGVPATLLGHGWREAMFNRGEFSAFALFADVIWHANDRLNITFGARYTKDKKKFQWLNGPREAPELDATLEQLDDLGLLALAGASPQDFQFDLVFDQSALAGIPCDNGVTVAEGVSCVLERSYSDFSPRLVVDYELADDVMVFASVTKGYKAGGFNSVEIASEFENEDVSSFEIGLKSIFPDAGILLNVSGFRYVYLNKQSVRLSTASTVPQYVVETSDDQAWGADFQLDWKPISQVNLFANAQFIDATFKKRVLQDGTDLAGQPTGEPKLSAAFGVRLNQELAGGSRISFQAIPSYNGPGRENDESIAQGAASDTPAFETGGAQNRTDVRLNWNSASDKIEAGIFVNNLFDNRYVLGINNITRNTLGTPFVSLSDP
ncbi:MAG: TonB-dependent receptor, partial [Sandaracinobacteroides sp.]